MEEEIKNGCLGLGHTSDDWLLEAESVEIDKLPTLYQQDEIRFEYNQGSSNDCTIYSALGSLSDLVNIQFTQEDIDECNEESYKRGRIRGKGWYVKDAVDTVCKRWNSKHKDNPVCYYYISKWNTDLINKVTDKGYTICSGYYGNSAYNKDRADNICIDNAEWGKYTYGHALSVLKRNGKLSVKDSYKGRKDNGKDSNFYTLAHNLCEMSQWHTGGYIILLSNEEKIEEKKRLVAFREKVELMIKTNSEMWFLTNDKKFKEELHVMNEELRRKLVDIEKYMPR